MKITLLDNDIITFELDNGILIGTGKESFIDLNIVQKIVSDRLEVQKGEIYPLLINMKGVKNTTQEARSFLASEHGCKGVSAAAILVDSALGCMIGNFFILVNKPLVPTKLFTYEAEAKKWLTKYILS